VFYAGWKWQYLPLIFASSTIDYLLALKISGLEDPAQRKRWLVITVIVNLGMLGFFKYWNFSLETVQGILGFFRGGPGPDLRGWMLGFALPVGISFFTFESMSYVVDVYRREIPVCRSYLRYLLFVAFFPHLVAGPIVRPAQLLPQFDAEPRLDLKEGGEGLFLIAAGLLKKVVIGDYLAINLVDRVFDRTSSFSALETLAGVYGYALQIYCDFSGYTDVAIGSALLLGIRINENFRSPYQATNLQEFWQRWHISLSTWLRDYLYIPLGGSRGGPWFTYRNMMITMLLGGLWHGASWTFVFWGFLHGAAQAVGRAWQRARAARPETPPPANPEGGPYRHPKPTADALAAAEPLWQRILWGLVTFHFVCFAWIFFRAPTFDKALAVIKQLGSLTTFHPNLPPKLLGVMALGFATHLLPHSLYDRLKERFIALPAPAQALCLLVAAYVLREATSSAVVPFIYFQF
jgi:D-alanyl-lipoteichoic acid acyltransferase DltB (MBOAT superfamily)